MTKNGNKIKRFLPYSRQFIDQKDIKKVSEVLRKNLITQGPKIASFEKKFTEYVLSTDSELIKKFPERFPFILVGGDDGNNFHDTATGGVTLHSQESLENLKKITGFNLVHTRFRTNIIIEDSDPWNELNWIGKKININQNNFVVEKAVPRCLAINCNPDTGERDHNLLKSMLQIQAARPPEFAIKLIPQELKGIINIGDEVKVI